MPARTRSAVVAPPRDAVAIGQCKSFTNEVCGQYHCALDVAVRLRDGDMGLIHAIPRYERRN